MKQVERPAPLHTIDVIADYVDDGEYSYYYEYSTTGNYILVKDYLDLVDQYEKIIVRLENENYDLLRQLTGDY